MISILEWNSNYKETVFLVYVWLVLEKWLFTIRIIIISSINGSINITSNK